MKWKTGFKDTLRNFALFAHLEFVPTNRHKILYHVNLVKLEISASHSTELMNVDGLAVCREQGPSCILAVNRLSSHFVYSLTSAISFVGLQKAADLHVRRRVESIWRCDGKP